MFNSLSGRVLVLTVIFVMMAEVLIFVPSVASFREDFFRSHLERAQIASLTLLANDMIDPALETELLTNAGVYNVVLHRDEARQLVLSSPIPAMIENTFDLREASAVTLIIDALSRIATPESEVVRVIGMPVREGGLAIEVTMSTAPLRTALIAYGLNILALSLVISVITAGLLFLAMRRLLLTPIQKLVGNMQSYAAAPEDARRIISPTTSARELRLAEEALHELQTDLTQSLKQRERLAQLGEAVAKISHDLRNILTSAQLFTDRIESSEDPTVRRLAPKLENSIRRAVTLCENTLSFGKAQEPAPKISQFSLAELVDDVFEGERLANENYDLSYAGDVPEGMMLSADNEQMFRVIGNLVRNARQAIVTSGQPGEIDVVARDVENGWSIRVSDNGPGLPPKAQEHLFQPFQGNVRKGGAGLGLAIAQELVRGHGGQLTLAETGPEGTCFEIELPKADTNFSK
ncbi:MAG: HAMP domain-containing sensor histidine kinase [Paracoccaceae bacterium]|nr:HAMP domain-containing sensor histidine kinase [Paracoccaceae bacterium]MDG2258635.1 HAMP domain-containing sensor histidine kinase [Paracoccaceae bacterium]